MASATLFQPTLVRPMREQLATAGELHAKDLAAGLGEVRLPYALEGNYPNAAKQAIVTAVIHRKLPMRWALVLTMVFCITSCSPAEYNPYKLGEAAGAYLYTVCVANELQNSQCNYLVTQSIPLQPIITDIESHLKTKDLIEFRGYKKEIITEMRQKAHEFISGAMGVSTKNGEIDTRTACGMLFQNNATLLAVAEQKWEEAKKLYFK